MRSTECAVHVHHSLVPVEKHHIQPKQYHGSNEAGNLTQICANGHGDAHYLLERMLKTGNNLSWEERRTYGQRVRWLATRGYYAIIAYGVALGDAQ